MLFFFFLFSSLCLSLDNFYWPVFKFFIISSDGCIHSAKKLIVSDVVIFIFSISFGSIL